MFLRQIAALARLSLLDLYRRKDLVVVFLLAAVAIVPLAFFAPFGVPGAGRQMSELALLLVWAFSLVISVGVAARLMPPEFSGRTIYPLLAKPVSRGTVLLGKFAGGALASLSALLLFYAAYALLIGFREGRWLPPVLVQAFILHAGFVLLVTALTLLGSLVLTPSANWTLVLLVSVAMILFGSRLPVYAATQPPPLRAVVAVLHWIAPHLDFFDMRLRVVHHWPPIPWSLCGVVTLYAWAYSALCLWLAALAFRHRRV